MRNVTETVKQLIIINVLFFVGTLALGDVAYKYLALYFPENPSFELWQIISHMFMHGGFMHIFFNMTHCTGSFIFITHGTFRVIV